MTKYIQQININDILLQFKDSSNFLFEYYKNLLNRIESIEPHINAFVEEENRNERVFQELKQLVEKYKTSDNKPALYGIPIGIKDIFVTNGLDTKAGSKLPAKLFNGKESSFVTKLKQAGAIIIGKTHTTEFAYFEPAPTANPHNVLHTPGGSSSGSAAAIAAGLCSIASATQTIGSISRPASYCGVIGFKPSYARIPADGIIPFSPSLDHIGFMANNLDDIKVVAKILCLDWVNKSTSKQPTIGFIKQGKYISQADSEMQNFYYNYIDKLKNSQYKIVEMNLFQNIEEINKAHKNLAAFELAKVHKDWFPKYKNLYRKSTHDLIIEGINVEFEEIAEAIAGRNLLRNIIETEMHNLGVDIIITPSAINAAPVGLQSTGSPLMNLPWTYSGLPTLSMPIRKSNNNLPLGLQIAAKYQNDEELIEYSYELEKKLKNNI